MDIQTYFSTTIIIPAGQIRRVPIVGKYVIILSNSITTNPYIGVAGRAFYELPGGVGVPYPKGFTSLSFQNPAGVSMTLFIAVSTAPIDDQRYAFAMLAPLEAIRDELQGIATAGSDGTEKTIGVAQSTVLSANTSRKGFNLQAKSTNAGIIYLGFTNAVTTAIWFAELQSGQACMMDDYRGPVFGIASIAAQLLGWGEW